MPETDTCEVLLEYCPLPDQDKIRNLPNRESIEGTPLDTSSWALYKEGLQPRGWEGLPELVESFFLKLEEAIF